MDGERVVAMRAQSIIAALRRAGSASNTCSIHGRHRYKHLFFSGCAVKSQQRESRQRIHAHAAYTGHTGDTRHIRTHKARKTHKDTRTRNSMKNTNTCTHSELKGVSAHTHSKAKQSKAKQSKAKQSKAKQSKAKQSKAKQSKAKQSKLNGVFS